MGRPESLTLRDFDLAHAMKNVCLEILVFALRLFWALVLACLVNPEFTLARVNWPENQITAPMNPVRVYFLGIFQVNPEARILEAMWGKKLTL